MNKALTIFDTVVGAIGAFFGYLYGPWTGVMSCLIVCMVIDYVTGVVVAAFGFSLKSKNGGLSSHIGWLGLAKKVGTMILLAVVHIVGLVIPGAEAVYDVAVIGYVANEVVSICENMRLMGISLGPINGLLDVLKPLNAEEKADEEAAEDGMLLNTEEEE